MLAYIYTLRSVFQLNSLEQYVTKPEAALFLTHGLGVLQLNIITSHPTKVDFQFLCTDAGEGFKTHVQGKSCSLVPKVLWYYKWGRKASD